MTPEKTWVESIKEIMLNSKHFTKPLDWIKIKSWFRANNQCIKFDVKWEGVEFDMGEIVNESIENSESICTLLGFFGKITMKYHNGVLLDITSEEYSDSQWD